MTTNTGQLRRSSRLVLSRHVEAPSEDQFIGWCRQEREAGRHLAVDLFSGAGGLGAGVEAAGWTVAVAVDHDKAALETHRANFRGQALNVDMADPSQVEGLIEILRPLEIDLVSGGPPCQPFSRAGRAKIRSLINEGIRGKTDKRKDLWRSFVDVVLALKPRAVLMENVPDMALGDDLDIVRSIAVTLETTGYAVDYRLLDAWRFGVPQHRKRFILQARKDGIMPIWPKPADDRPTVRDAIGDLPPLNGTTGARELLYSGQPASVLAISLRDRTTDVIYDHMTRPVRTDDLEAFKLMTASTLYSDLPDRLRRYRSDTFRDKYKRLDWNDLSRTITAHIAKDGYWYIHPEEHRTLTVREAARIQTFPDSFRFAGSRSDAFRQIGNAVPPLLGRAVVETLLPSAVPRNEVPRLPELRQRLAQWGSEKREIQWWLFPGAGMTKAAAAVAALLEVHRLSQSKAESIMTPLRGVSVLSSELLEHVDKYLSAETRLETLRRLRLILSESPQDEWISHVLALLSNMQRQVFSLLCAENELVVNEHVRRVVTLLMELPEGYTGLRTDVKLALAQLVTKDEYSALRMCSIRAISISEAEARILRLSSFDSGKLRRSGFNE